jgi:hypothetical protein
MLAAARQAHNAAPQGASIAPRVPDPRERVSATSFRRVHLS